MTLVEKINLFTDLSSEERMKVENKFLVTLSLISTDRINDILNYLSSEGVRITKAKDIKVVGNTMEEIQKKFSILDEIHAKDLYRQDPGMLNKNVIDIYKKIKYCIQIGKEYKNEDGTYKKFVTNESEWQKEFNKESELVIDSISAPVEEEIVTVEPVVDDVISFNEEAEVQFDNVIDINDYISASNDMKDLEAKTTNFAKVRAELENQLAELDALKSEEEISFSDLEPDGYEMRRAA